MEKPGKGKMVQRLRRSKKLHSVFLLSRVQLCCLRVTAAASASRRVPSVSQNAGGVAELLRVTNLQRRSDSDFCTEARWKTGWRRSEVLGSVGNHTLESCMQLQQRQQKLVFQ